jgi:hypothetical protein
MTKKLQNKNWLLRFLSSMTKSGLCCELDRGMSILTFRLTREPKPLEEQFAKSL